MRGIQPLDSHLVCHHTPHWRGWVLLVRHHTPYEVSARVRWTQRWRWTFMCPLSSQQHMPNGGIHVMGYLGAQAQAMDHSLSQSCSEQAALRATRVGFYEFVETTNYLVLVCVVFPSCNMQLCVWGPQNYIKCPVQANRGVRH